MSRREPLPFDELLETCLYAQSPVERDVARAALIRHSNAARVPTLMAFLEAPQRLIRRRALRLLADIHPRVARPYIESLFKKGTAKVRSVVAVARMLSSQTKASEPLLGLGLEHEDVRIRQACATRAAPIDALLSSLSDVSQEVRNKSANALNELEATFSEHDLAPMCSVMEQSDEDCRRLLLRCVPDHRALVDMDGVDALTIDYTKSLRHIESHPGATEAEKAWAVSRLGAVTNEHARAKDPIIRQAYARATSAETDLLKALAEDKDPGTKWLAQRALGGHFQPSLVESRLAPHERLSVPSAQPPYGIRADDPRNVRERAHAALAICYGRIDVNIGVAVRSAEAAGFSHVFVVGTRPLMKAAMRGTDMVVNLQMVPDGPSLIRVARTLGFQLVAVQQTPSSEPFHTAEYPPRPLFMMGAEDVGLPDSLRLAADLAIEIPMFGEIDSLNVATAATTVMFHWRLNGSPILFEEEAPCI